MWGSAGGVEQINSAIDRHAAINREVVHAHARCPRGRVCKRSLVRCPGRKLIEKEVISKEEMSKVVDEAGVLLSQGNAVAMRQALQLLRWLRKGLGIEDAAKAEGASTTLADSSKK